MRTDRIGAIKTFQDDGNFLYLDCGNGYICQNSWNATLLMDLFSQKLYIN